MEPLCSAAAAGSWPVFEALFPGFEASVPAVPLQDGPVRYLVAPRHVPPGQGVEVAALLFPAWRAGAAATLTRLRPEEMPRALVESGTWPPREPALLRELLGWLGSVPGWRLTYGDRADAVRIVHALG
jgi:hypothetical protein